MEREVGGSTSTLRERPARIRSVAPSVAPMTVDQLDAEALALLEEAETEAAADAARARAARLRSEAEADVDRIADEPGPARSRRPWLRRPTWTTVLVSVAVIASCLLLAVSGLMVWQDRQAASERHRAAEFTAAARQSVLAVLSLDFNKADQDVQRIVDSSTGQFRDEFQKAAEEFINATREQKVVSKGDVEAAAVQSMTDDSAEVLVAATSSVTNAGGAKDEPRSWRIYVSVTREGDLIKMSKLEFVP